MTDEEVFDFLLIAILKPGRSELDEEMCEEQEDMVEDIPNGCMRCL